MKFYILKLIKIPLQIITMDPTDNNSNGSQQTITSTRIDQDLWCHMASLGHPELQKHEYQLKYYPEKIH